MYRYLGNLYPKKIREGYLQLLRYSDFHVNPLRFIGFIGVFGFLFALGASFFLGLLGLSFLLAFIGTFIFFQALVYLVLLLRADAKAKFVESILPDVLQLMASNLRAGLTTDKALLLSARPEFGPFQAEINQVGKEITTGKEISLALLEMTTRIKSERLSKTVSLIVSGLRSGGELASLLEQTARNLRQEVLVDSRIRANVMMYVIFIFVAVCMGAPMLFGLSSFLVEVFSKNLSGFSLPENTASSLPLSFSKISISPDFVVLFSITFLVTSAIFGSMILGLISKGHERDGIKFLPVLVILSLIVFFVIRYAIRKLLAGFFGL